MVLRRRGLVRAWQYLQCWRLEPAVRAPVCGLFAAPRESSLLCLSWSLLPPCGPGRHRRRGMLPALLLASLGGAAEEIFWKPPGAVAIFSVRVWRMLQRIGVLTREAPRGARGEAAAAAGRQRSVSGAEPARWQHGAGKSWLALWGRRLDEIVREMRQAPWLEAPAMHPISSALIS